MRKMKRLQTILTLILTLTMLSFGTNNQSDKNDLEFNSEKWKSGDIRTKGKMTDNLLIGKTKYLKHLDNLTSRLKADFITQLTQGLNI
jgi:hypothetical protein